MLPWQSCMYKSHAVCRSGVPTVANSWRRNATGLAEFQQSDWIADRVMASDPRRLDVVLLHRPDDAPEISSAGIERDPNFLGVASFHLAQVWELLSIDQQHVEARLQLKLGPAGLPQCTGNIILSVVVEAEAYQAGVRYRQ